MLSTDVKCASLSVIVAESFFFLSEKERLQCIIYVIKQVINSDIPIPIPSVTRTLLVDEGLLIEYEEVEEVEEEEEEDVLEDIIKGLIVLVIIIFCCCGGSGGSLTGLYMLNEEEYDDIKELL